MLCFQKPFSLLSSTTTALECIKSFGMQNTRNLFFYSQKSLCVKMRLSASLEKAICFVKADGFRSLIVYAL